MAGPPRPNRREWRVLSLLAPSLKLDPWAPEQPFSVKPDKKVTVRDLMAIHRDIYEGTPFDQTKNPLAGPFGSPNRWTLARDYKPAEGYMPTERMIAVHQCSYVIVLQARAGHAAVDRQPGVVRAGRCEDVGVHAVLRGQPQGAGGVRDRPPRPVRPQLRVLGVELHRQLVEPELARDDPGHPREAGRDRGQAVRGPAGHREDRARAVQDRSRSRRGRSSATTRTAWRRRTS